MDTTMNRATVDAISSPAIRKLVERSLTERRDNGSRTERMNYDKFTHEETSTCLCVLGGM